MGTSHYTDTMYTEFRDDVVLAMRILTATPNASATEMCPTSRADGWSDAVAGIAWGLVSVYASTSSIGEVCDRVPPSQLPNHTGILHVAGELFSTSPKMSALMDPLHAREPDSHPASDFIYILSTTLTLIGGAAARAVDAAENFSQVVPTDAAWERAHSRLACGNDSEYAQFADATEALMVERAMGTPGGSGDIPFGALADAVRGLMTLYMGIYPLIHVAKGHLAETFTFSDTQCLSEVVAEVIEAFHAASHPGRLLKGAIIG